MKALQEAVEMPATKNEVAEYVLDILQQMQMISWASGLKELSADLERTRMSQILRARD